MAAVGFATILFCLIIGLQGRPLGELDAFLPPREAEPKSQARAALEEGWPSDYAVAVEVSKRTGRPLFIDFTG